MAGIKIGLDPTHGRWPLTTLGRTSTSFPLQISFCNRCREWAREGVAAQGLGKGEEKTEKEQRSAPRPLLRPQAARVRALQGGAVYLGLACGLHRGSGLKIIFSDGSHVAGRVLSTQWGLSICGMNDGMKSPPDSGTKGALGPC